MGYPFGRPPRNGRNHGISLVAAVLWSVILIVLLMMAALYLLRLG